MTHKNLIAGEAEIENRNPSDRSDLVGVYAQASAEQLDATFEAGIRMGRVVSELQFNENLAYAGLVTSEGAELTRATQSRRNARTGVVSVNRPIAGINYHVPFGGPGDSSYGPREQDKTASEFYATIKTAYINSGIV